MKIRGTRLVINTAYCLGRFKEKNERAQKWVDNEVLKDTEPFVPMRSGDLARSGQRGTVIGSGKVIYAAPHAKPQYKRFPNKSKAKHPQATMAWFEASKAVNKDKWLKGVRKVVTNK